jgi:hypothetical protein
VCEEHLERLSGRSVTHFGWIVVVEEVVLDLGVQAVGQREEHGAGRLAVLPIRATRPGQRDGDVGSEQPPDPIGHRGGSFRADHWPGRHVK